MTVFRFLIAPALALGIAVATLAVNAVVGKLSDGPIEVGFHQSGMTGCVFGDWSAPRPVAPSGDQTVARYPRVALGTHASYVVGVDIQLFDEHLLGKDLLVVRQIGDKTIGSPRGNFTFMSPRAAVDGNGRLHLLWAEADTIPLTLEAREWSMRQPTTLWTSVYDPTRGWATPRVVEHFPTLRWTNRSGDALGNAGAFQVFPVWSRRGASASGRQLSYYVLGESEWNRREVPLHRSPSYASVAGDGRRVFVAYLASDPTWAKSADNPSRADENSVFIVVSEDSGATWSHARLVSQSGRFPAQQILALYHDETVHLVWKQPIAGGGAVVRHLRSTDGALTWSRPQDLNPGYEFDALRTVLDGCGTIHLVYEDWRNGTMRGALGYSTWSGSWSPPERLFPELVAMSPDLRIDTYGNPTLVFVASADIASRPHPYRTLISSLQRRVIVTSGGEAPRSP